MFEKEERFNQLIGSAEEKRKIVFVLMHKNLVRFSMAEQIRINNSISGLGESISMGPNLPVAIATESISQGPIKEPGNSYLTRIKCLNR